MNHDLSIHDGIVHTHHGGVPIYGHHSADKLPNFDAAQGDEVVEIPAGEAVTVTGNESCMHLIVYGSVNISGSLRAHTVTVMPGGTYEQTGELLFRPDPLDATRDPGEFGRGLLVFGTAGLVGPVVDKSASLARPVAAGDTAIHLTNNPFGWRVGDLIVLPETTYLPRMPNLSNEEVIPDPVMGQMVEEFRIQAIHGPIVVLDRPARYEHAQFMAFNLSRRCVVRSEDSDNPGHVICFPDSIICFRSVEFHAGRTAIGPLGDGNQVGRYGVHTHHGVEGAVFHNCSVIRPNRWGIVIHDSHRNAIRDNIVYGATGSAFVTEAGTEYQNDFSDNVALLCKGSGEWIESRSNVHARATGERLWHLGSGFGFNSGANTTRGNLAVNCQMGFGVAGHAAHLDLTQADGTTLSWRLDNHGAYPFGGWSGNAAYYCTTGMEIWNAPTTEAIPFKGFTAVGCNQGTNIVDTSPTNWIEECQFVDCNYCVVFRPGYEFDVTLSDCYMEGNVGYRMIDTVGDLTIQRTTMHCSGACIYQPAGVLARRPRVCRIEDCALDAPSLIRAVNTRGTGVGTQLVLNGRSEKYINTFPVRWEWVNTNGENLNLFLNHQTPEFVLPAGRERRQYQDLVLPRNGDMLAAHAVCILGYMAPPEASPHPRMANMLAAPYQPVNPPTIRDVQLSRSGTAVKVTVRTDRPCRVSVRYLARNGRWAFTRATPQSGSPHRITIDEGVEREYRLWIYARDAAGVPAHDGRMFVARSDMEDD